LINSIRFERRRRIIFMRKANDREIKKLAPLRSTISRAAGALTISLPMRLSIRASM
jgi:hypothetical protein